MPAHSTSLEGELERAETIARSPSLQPCLTACRRASEPPDPGLRWGIDFVEFSGTFYQPEPSGEPSVIVMANDAEEQPVDLVACGWRSRRIASRCGNAVALGEDWIADSREFGTQLMLLSHPTLWLALRGAGAVIVDWHAVPDLLDGLPEVFCDGRSLARRLHAVTRRMADPPRLLFRKGDL